MILRSAIKPFHLPSLCGVTEGECTRLCDEGVIYHKPQLTGSNRKAGIQKWAHNASGGTLPFDFMIANLPPGGRIGPL